MRELKEKACVDCGEIYKPTGSCSKRCPKCRVIHEKIYSVESQRLYRLRKGIPPVGKGGSTKPGKDNPNYRNNIKYFYKRRKELFENYGKCELCGKDLSNATRYQWCLHHIDGNRNNNVDSNFKLLCKRCHQITHNCIKNLEGVETNERDPLTGRFLPKRSSSSVGLK